MFFTAGNTAGYFRYLILFISFFSSQMFPQTDSTDVNYNRLSLSLLGAGMTTAASFYVVNNAWWSGQSVSFHFDDGNDLKYAKNIDKLGHFFGGYIVQDIYYDIFRWSHISSDRSLIMSTGMSIFTQIMIDVKDGYSPEWGFSWQDVAAGSAGAVYGAVQKKYPFFEDIRIKISYMPRKDKYDPQHEWLIEDIIEDYPNQTYWVTFPFSKISPAPFRRIIPDYLGLALGMGVDDEIWELGGGTHEYYAAFDIDLEKLCSGSDNFFIKAVCRTLNYIKMPSPALRIKDGATFYGLYF